MKMYAAFADELEKLSVHGEIVEPRAMGPKKKLPKKPEPKAPVTAATVPTYSAPPSQAASGPPGPGESSGG